MLTKTCKKTEIVRDVTTTFGNALLNKDLKTIVSLLSEDGIYEIQSPRLNTLQVEKKRFVTWFKKRLKQESELTITYDQCMHCYIGGIVLLLNNGKFPRQIKDSSERSKTGLMLEVKDGLISRVKFCYVFVKSDNMYVYEIRIARIKYYIDQGNSYWAAKRIAEQELLE